MQVDVMIISMFGHANTAICRLTMKFDSNNAEITFTNICSLSQNKYFAAKYLIYFMWYMCHVIS